MLAETRTALADFMRQSSKSQRQISRETGLSTSVISQFLNSSYTGDNEEVARTISQYLTISKKRLNTVSTTQFYPELRNTEDVLFTCFYAHQHNEIALVTGDAGAGKTTALHHYTDTSTGVIFCDRQRLYHFGHRCSWPDMQRIGAEGSGPESNAHGHPGRTAQGLQPPDYH